MCSLKLKPISLKKNLTFLVFTSAIESLEASLASPLIFDYHYQYFNTFH